MFGKKIDKTFSLPIPIARMDEVVRKKEEKRNGSSIYIYMCVCMNGRRKGIGRWIGGKESKKYRKRRIRKKREF